MDRPRLELEGAAVLAGVKDRDGNEIAGKDAGMRGTLRVMSPDRRLPGRCFAEFCYGDGGGFRTPGGAFERRGNALVFRSDMGGHVYAFLLEGDGGDDA